MRALRDGWVGLLIVTWSVCWAGIVTAQTNPAEEASRAEARILFQAGVDAGKAGRWIDAREAYERSFMLYPSPGTRLNLAGSELQLGHLTLARDHYRAVLAGADEHSRIPRADVELQLADLERRIPRLELLGHDPQLADAVILDGRALASWERTIAVDPGSHEVALARDGTRLAARVVEVAEGELLTLDLAELCRLCSRPVPRDEARAPSAQPEQVQRLTPVNVTSQVKVSPAPRIAPHAKVVPWVLVSTGCAAMSVAGMLGIAALRRDHQLAAGCGETGTCHESDLRRLDRVAITVDVLAIAGAALAVGGGLGFLLRKRHPAQPSLTRGSIEPSVGVAF